MYIIIITIISSSISETAALFLCVILLHKRHFIWALFIFEIFWKLGKDFDYIKKKEQTWQNKNKKSSSLDDMIII